eukprot:768120-Hanusia_phi.AAC.6
MALADIALQGYQSIATLRVEPPFWQINNPPSAPVLNFVEIVRQTDRDKKGSRDSKMYGAQGARSGSSTRIPDLLEQLKSEYDALGQESTLLKAQKEDFERKLESQIAELNMMTQTLTELERQHRQMKNTVIPNGLCSSSLVRYISLQYEDEIKWLKRQIESAGGVVQPRKDATGAPTAVPKVEGSQSSALPSCFSTAAGL